MKRKLKAVENIIFALILCFGAAGCSKSSGENANETVVNIWTGDSHSKKVMLDIIDEFNETSGKENNIKIVYTVQPNASNSLEVAMNSSSGPELFASGNLQKYVENGWVRAIEDMPGGKEFLKNYSSDELKTYQVDGKTYKVPFYVNTFGIMYNKDLFKKNGIVDEKGEAKPPETLDEFRETAKKLTNAKKMQYGLILPLKDGSYVNNSIVFPAMRSKGKFVYDPVDGKFEFGVIEDNLECMLGIKKDKSMFPSAETLDNDAARAQFAEGNIGMIFTGSYDYGVMKNQFPTDVDWGVASLPVSDKGEAYKQRMASDGYLYINNKMVNEGNEEKVMLVYKWFHSNEVLEKLYKNGVALPYNYDEFKDIKFGDDMKQWKEYFELIKISTVLPTVPPYDLMGGKTFRDVINDEVWTGNITPNEAIADLNARYNKALETYFSKSPKYPREYYIDTTWDISIKQNN